MLLLSEYQRLKVNHERAVQLRVARATLGSSVMRVFAKDTRPDLIKALDRIPVRELRAITGDDAFRVVQGCVRPARQRSAAIMSQRRAAHWRVSGTELWQCSITKLMDHEIERDS